MTIENFYTDEELDLIWEELVFLTKPGKLYDPGYIHGAVHPETGEILTKSRSIQLDVDPDKKDLYEDVYER